MLASNNQCRREMMGKGGDDDGLRRTVECLRGRLQAERMASKAAKEEAERMARRLEGVERQLGEEIKSRNRAEKRLRYALKKLEALKLLDVVRQLDLPGSSASSSSSQCSSGNQRLGGSKPGSPMGYSAQCGSEKEENGKRILLGCEDILGEDLSVCSSVDLPHQLVSQEGSWSSVGSAQSHNMEEPHRGEAIKDHIPQESTADDMSQSSASSDKPGSTKHQAEHVDNMLALVPACVQPNSEARKQVTKNDVQGVLVTLRHLKEQLQYSLDKKAGAYPSKELCSW